MKSIRQTFLLLLAISFSIQSYPIRFVKPKTILLRLGGTAAVFGATSLLIAHKYPSFIKKLHTVFDKHPLAYSIILGCFALPSLIHLVSKRSKRKSTVSRTSRSVYEIPPDGCSQKRWDEINHWANTLKIEPDQRIYPRQDDQGRDLCDVCDVAIPNPAIGKLITHKQCKKCGITYCLKCVDGKACCPSCLEKGVHEWF